jgi:hypothetical protein
LMLMALTGAGTSLWGQTGGFAYVANCASYCGAGGTFGNVSAYSVDGMTGALFAAGPGPFAMTIR